MLVESAIAFTLILAATSFIYLLGRRVAPKPVQSEGAKAVYACGEEASYPKLKVNVSLYKYLIFFVILDSSVLLLAFTSFRSQTINIPLILVYLLMMLASSAILLDGGKE